MSIEIKNINKYFGNIQVLKNISFNISSNKKVAIIGPSGSGKTTLLRIISGLENQNSGELKFYNQNVTYLSANQRKVGFVFQNYALFRHMNILENVSFGLNILPRNKRPNNTLIKKEAMNLLKIIKLPHLAHFYPSQLSGGQKQRVALVRALIIKPKILLLDEPFGALDTPVRKELRRWLRQLQHDLKFTSIFVTHDQEEAMEISDKIIIMNKGKIEQIGTPYNVWRYPKNQFVLQFLSEVNEFQGKILGSFFYIGNYRWPLKFSLSYEGKVKIFLRPWEIDINNISTLKTPLPVKIIQFIKNTDGNNNWTLIVISEELNSEFITIKTNKKFYTKNNKIFLGFEKARLYKDNLPLNIKIS